MMRRLACTLTACLSLLSGLPALAEDAATLQAQFNRRYQDYFGAGSQTLLPFPAIEKSEWKNMRETRPLKLVFSEPDKYYNAKVYSLTLYQASDDGSYYLDAKGGFWGMDELVYGPIPADALK